MKLYIFINLAASCILINACKEGCTTNELYLFGRIDKAFAARIQTINTNNATLTISSGGGLPSQAIISAANIKRHHNNLVVRRECLSACAEYLLPVAKTVEFRDNPLIGFHWNAMMIRSLHKKNAYKDLEFCTGNDSKLLAELQKNAGVNSEFWEETLIKLGRSNYTVYYRNNECPWKDMDFENRLWLPTSKQLREKYRLNFTGSVCADDFEVCAKRVDQRWDKLTRIVIGDKVYVSKGHKH